MFLLRIMNATLEERTAAVNEIIARNVIKEAKRRRAMRLSMANNNEDKKQ
ncbi:hypothetical protein NO1_0348 [Candidatus Termititenax aidoneus]|uniref:Uncharacterized protein n=1 Tax=Termititenax aidoneus TaxID=2218524 RepID=A0A388T8E4_TERA1|nr:hypothetical protein NO1_0348 [Candidatus Termititenax aidoneus]